MVDRGQRAGAIAPGLSSIGRFVVVISVIILSMGDRPEALAKAISSTREQAGVDIEIVLVVNGGDPDGHGADVIVEPGENLGIPGGRNAGVAASRGDLLAFLDDDAYYLGDTLAPAQAAFDADAELGVVGLRLVDETGATARRHQPRIGRATYRGASSSFPGGASLVRRKAFESVDGLCGAYRYGLEETDLAWRLIDAGWQIRFEPELLVFHPRTDPSRHDSFNHHTARNRVWLAHRCLPALLAPIYVVNWALITVARQWRNPSACWSYARGTVEGLHRLEGPRRPMRWSTVGRLTRLGRPPVI